MSKNWSSRPVVVPQVKIKDLEVAFRGLRCEEGYEELREVLMPMYIEDLISMIAPDDPPPPMNYTVDQIAKVKRHGSALLNIMMRLRGPAIEALQFRGGPTLREFKGWLGRLIEAASHAKIANPEDHRRGPKPKLRARKIAEAAAYMFVDVTGKRPTIVVDRVVGKAKASGEFFDFLTKVFAALDVKAGVERYAKDAICAWKKERYAPPPDPSVLLARISLKDD